MSEGGRNVAAMRILHTSDWHIGRTFHGYPTLDALREVLDALAASVREHDVDVVLVAGDVFDSAAPSADSFALLTDALRAISDAGAQIIVTSGNHDSVARLGFQSTLLRAGVHVITDPASVGTPITLSDASGPVHFYGIPFLEPALVRHLWTDPDGERTPVRTQREALTQAMGLVRADLDARGERERSVVLAHCFAAGMEPTPGLERDIQQGGLDVVPLSVFDGPDYVALGHIHGRQQLSERARYAGAPLHYSFGEQHKPRGAWLVDLDAAGLAEVQWLDLPVPRPLVTLTGTLSELLNDPRFADAEDAWVCAEYTDATIQIDPMRRLRERFRYCANVVHHNAVVHEPDGMSYAGRVREARNDLELIDTFLAHVREGEGASEREREILQQVIEARTLAEVTA